MGADVVATTIGATGAGVVATTTGAGLLGADEVVVVDTTTVDGIAVVTVVAVVAVGASV